MTSRSRFLAACACQPLDRPPIWVMRQAGRYLPEYRALKAKSSFLEMVRTPAIAAEVFETQETLEALRAAPADAEIRGEVLARRDALGERLRALRTVLECDDSAWSSPGELKRRLTEIAYLTTLFGDVDEALGEGPRGTRHRH